MHLYRENREIPHELVTLHQLGAFPQFLLRCSPDWGAFSFAHIAVAKAGDDGRRCHPIVVCRPNSALSA